MSDQGFHEIQLSGKQLVFGFMSLLVLVVVVFLLGVSVGRGVRPATATGTPLTADAGASSDTTVPTVMPPATKTTPNELDFHERLQGRGADAAKAAEPPAPSADAAPPPKPAAAEPVKPNAGAPPSQAPPAGAVWQVQIDSFNSKNLAEAEVGQLKTKGYAAFIFNSPPPGPPYRVRVGPFAVRAEAQRIADRLQKEGYRPSVIR